MLLLSIQNHRRDDDQSTFDSELIEWSCPSLAYALVLSGSLNPLTLTLPVGLMHPDLLAICHVLLLYVLPVW